MAKDNTDNKNHDVNNSEEVLRTAIESATRMQNVLETIREGVWDWDIQTNAIYHNNQWYNILGIDNDSKVGHLDEFVNLIHPDDKELVMGRVSNLLEGRTKTYRSEHRMVRPDGKIIRVEDRGRITKRSIDGKPLQMTGSFTDITERWEYQEQLKEARYEAELSNKAKSNFLATMSHEIRTPLNGITGMTSILSETNLTNEQRAYLDIIYQSSDALLSIITDILDLSKLEEDQLELRIEDCDLHQITHGVFRMMDYSRQSDKVDLKLDIDTEHSWLCQADAGRIRQVLINLVSNALKFTEQGKVTISVSDISTNEENGIIQFNVKDTGIGIEPEIIDSMFERFVQADSSTTNKYGGTGLGLAICKELVSLMQGKLGVSSQLGEGSNFWFEIPVLKKSSYTTIQSDIPKRTNSSIKELEVLVVEDNQVNQMVAKKMLEGLGHHVSIALNGQLGCEMVQQNDYDLIFMDIRMPVMDGLQATQKIRSLGGRFVEIPIVAMTANATKEDVNLSINAGMNEFLSKPIKKNRLEDTIKQLFS